MGFFLLLLTLVSLMLYFLELCPPNIRSNSDLCMLTFTDHYFSMHLRSGAPDTAVVLTETLTGSALLLFHCLLVSLKVWHWICEKGDQLCSVCEHCYLCIFHIEPFVPSVFFVSPSALLSEFVAFSVPGPLLCHTVSGSGLMGQIVLFHDCMLLYDWLHYFGLMPIRTVYSGYFWTADKYVNIANNGRIRGDEVLPVILET